MARRKRPTAAEYRLLITPGWNDRLQAPTTLVILETVQIFASFRYGLSVEEERDQRSLLYRVTGLKAPDLSLPGTGEARYTQEYEDLLGTVEFTVQGLDGESASCTVRITPERVRILSVPRTSRLTVFTEQLEWEKRSHS